MQRERDFSVELSSAPPKQKAQQAFCNLVCAKPRPWKALKVEVGIGPCDEANWVC